MDKEFGLVLAGGGTKGAYEVGVWKALKELNINITAIAGTSIGALNAALILQDDFEKMVDLYKTIEFDNIISMDKKIDKTKNIFNIKNLGILAAEYIEKGGLENNALRDTVNKYIDVDKIYNSPIDFGLVTSSIKGESQELFKGDISKEKMVDYLLATACFPIFKAQKIDNVEYYDGGLHDNIPINLLIKKGYKNIIVVDVTGIGIKRKTIDKNVYIKMIRADEDLGGTFEFNHEKIEKNMKLGYLDTLRAFNNAQGHYYYFSSEEFNLFLENFNLKTIYGLECAAKIYNMERYKKYKYEDFIKELLEKHDKSMKEYNLVKGRMEVSKLVKYYKETTKMLNKGLGIPLLMDLTATQPSLRNSKFIKRTFSEYLEAADAMVELTNYIEN